MIYEKNNIQKFNLHTHTYRCGHSDSDMLDEDYIKEYIKMGFEKIAITEHYPQKDIIDSRKKIRLDYEQKEEYLNSIINLKNKYKDKIEILVGYEIEYLKEQHADIMELKEESDCIILGQHYIYNENGQLQILGKSDFSEKDLLEYVKNIETSIQFEIPNMIAHPDIYLINRKEFGKIEESIAHKICKLAEKNKVPLEINLNNIFQRTYNENRILNNSPIAEQLKKLNTVNYPRKEFWEIVSKYDIPVMYGIDAHYKGQISKWNELVELANIMIGKDIIKKLKFVKKV